MRCIPEMEPVHLICISIIIMRYYKFQSTCWVMGKTLSILLESMYSRTRLRRTRLGNNKKYVLTEVRLIRGTSYPST